MAKKKKNKKILSLVTKDVKENIEKMKKEIENNLGVEFESEGYDFRYLFYIPEDIDLTKLFTAEELYNLKDDEDQFYGEMTLKLVNESEKICKNIFLDMKKILDFEKSNLLIIDDETDDIFLQIKLKSKYMSTKMIA